MDNTSRLTADLIAHLWDAHVGQPTAKYPFTVKDVLLFARAIERECAQPAGEREKLAEECKRLATGACAAWTAVRTATNRADDGMVLTASRIFAELHAAIDRLASSAQQEGLDPNVLQAAHVRFSTRAQQEGSGNG